MLNKVSQIALDGWKFICFLVARVNPLIPTNSCKRQAFFLAPEKDIIWTQLERSAILRLRIISYRNNLYAVALSQYRVYDIHCQSVAVFLKWKFVGSKSPALWYRERNQMNQYRKLCPRYLTKMILSVLVIFPRIHGVSEE